MPPPLKLVVTSEHEEALWERKFLNTDTSLGLIQAVIFYLIKCFGLWQGKDLKLLKTEHVLFGENNIGHFVTVDIKMAMGFGKVIKRYDDPDNPRSVYKILKTYKGYLANEGPFLVRPISSIKDYVCYSPWPLGVNVIEHTVVNLMQECGAGSGYGNISVCLMAIDILKSFGAGNHCISTWIFRLYPRYKKTFWPDIFKRCCAINCEDKSQEACLMISHVLDPPYPAATMLVEMRKKQAMMKHKVETFNAQRTHVFNSWLLNINCKKQNDLKLSMNQGNDLLSPHAHKVRHVTKRQSIIESKTKNIKKSRTQNVSLCEKSSDSNIQPGSDMPSCVLEPSQITVKTEVMSDIDSFENKSISSDVRIMTVLSIPESAYSAQIDEAECPANENKKISFHDSKQTSASKLGHSSCHIKNMAVKRKLKCSKNFIKSQTQKTKQLKTDIKIEQMECSDLSEVGQILNGIHELDAGVDIDNEDHVTSLSSGVKVEMDVDCNDCIETEYVDSRTTAPDDENQKLDDGGKCIHSIYDKHQNENNGGNMSTNSNTSCEKCSLNLQDNLNSLQQSYRKSLSSCNDLPLDVSAIQHEGSHKLKVTNVLSEASFFPLSSPTSSLLSSSLRSLEQIKDSIKCLDKELNQKSDFLIKVPSSNSCIELECANKSVCSLNNTSDRINNKKCMTTSLQDQDDCTNHVPSPCREIVNVDSNQTKCRCGTKCTDGGLRTVTDPEHSHEELVNLDNTKNMHNFNLNGHHSVDIVQFLDATHKQLMNILQTSAAGSNMDCVSKDIVSHGLMQPSHKFSQKSYEFSLPSHGSMQPSHKSSQKLCKFSLPSQGSSESSKMSKLKKKQELKDIILSDIKSNTSETNVTSNLDSNVAELSHRCLVSATSGKTELQNSTVSVKDRPCPLLKTVLKDSISPLLKIRTSKHLSHVTNASQNKNRYIAVRSKTNRTLQTHLEMDKFKRSSYHNHGTKKLSCSSSSQTPPRSHKKHSSLKHSSDMKATFASGKAVCGCKLNQSKCSKIIKSRSETRSNHSSHTISTSETSSSSQLTKTSKDSDTKSGIYHCRSNRQDNAVYQTLHIKQEKQGTHTFTIADLSDHESSSCLNSQSSEICLGDYFPEGTVIPTRGVKLLTKQTSCGLEVILKFDFNLNENSKLNVNKNNENKTKGMIEEQDGSKPKCVEDSLNL